MAMGTMITTAIRVTPTPIMMARFFFFASDGAMLIFYNYSEKKLANRKIKNSPARDVTSHWYLAVKEKESFF